MTRTFFELNHEQMYKIICNKDTRFEGIFWTAVITTGIFCRPSCSAKKPKIENVEFFDNIKTALQKGYRPCKVCKPLQSIHQPSDTIQALIDEITQNPAIKLKDTDLIARGINPINLRRWFLRHHNMTFHAFHRLIKINTAFKKIQQGEPILTTAIESGYESLSGFNDGFKSIFGLSPTQMDTTIIDLQRIETPLGTMIACANQQGLCLLEFSDRKALPTELTQIAKASKATIIQGNNPVFPLLKTQLQEYFDGQRQQFSVPLSPIGTPFQQQVWQILTKIPYGTTCTYKQQAEKLGTSKAVRAIANANGANKISILIPCHRVIGSDGSLTGYGGGLWRKKRLLELEQGLNNDNS